ncbi:ABC transporter permease [Streptococcus tangpeifui]|uniref:ABC transporter permease n=1 Tax=Streptococcus tangpeifui TaxID=2709400 RepID=UPI0013EAEE42|nr:MULTISPECIES: ABC transporter permease [unclassified Streptococcus]
MFNVFTISLKNSLKDIVLLFWSICLPLAFIIGLHYFKVTLGADTLFGIITFSIFCQACITQSFSIFSQRKRGVFELLSVTPFSIWKYLSGIVLSQALLASLIALLLLTIEVKLFSLAITFGKILFFVPLFLTEAVLFSLFSFVLSRFPKDEAHLSTFTNLTMFALLLPSSIFWSLNHAPRFVQAISWINPFEWLQKGYRSILSHEFSAYMTIFGLLAISILLTAWLAQKTFRLKER